MKKDLLKKYFQGECTHDEAYEILKWMSTEKGIQEFHQAFEEFDSVYNLSEQQKTEMYDNVFNQIKLEEIARKIQAENDSVQLHTSVNKSRKRRFYLSKVAVIALILGFIASVLVWKPSGKEEKAISQMPSEVIKSTEAGQKLTVHLADGSVAVLNANSSISYPKQFVDSVRSIQMSGEVYFDVARDPAKPFVVNTSKLSTTALGTSFNIEAFSGQNHQVSLVTGKVKVQSFAGNVSETLSPGQAISFDGQKLVKLSFDPKTKILWKDGIIYFNSTPLEKAFKVLENWYDVKIEVVGENQTKGRLISGRFDNDYLVNVLNSLSYAQNFEYKVDQKRVTLRYKK